MALGLFERLNVALQNLQFVRTVLENVRDDAADERLLNRHISFVLHKRRFRVHHPELREVTTCLRFLRSEHRSKIKRSTQTHDPRLQIQLP